MSVTFQREFKRTRPIPQRKVKLVEELASYLKSYKYFMLASIQGITAPVLHETRTLLRERGTLLKVIKNRLFLKALQKLGYDISEFEKLLTGQNAAIFTNTNPFEVMIYLDKQKIFREAKAGDTATSEIVVPSGNTGIPPGPAISLFNKLKIPMRIQEGSIWVTKDTVVAKPGDVISQELAELLAKLGIKPIESKVAIKAIYLDGRIILPQEIEVGPEVYKEKIIKAHREAYNLAVNAALPIPEALENAIGKAHLEALALAVNAGIITKETAELVIAKAEAEARALYNILKQKVEGL